MRVLVLCDRVPDGPFDGLLLRLLNLARALRPRHSFDLACVRTRPNVTEAEAGVFDRIWSAPAGPQRPPAGWADPLTNWDPRRLYPVHPELVARLQHDIDPAGYDLIWDAGAMLFAQLPPRWDGVPVVADLVDDMVLTFRREMAAVPRWRDKLRLWKYVQVYGRFERDVMRRVAHCVVVGQADAESFSRVSPSVPVTVVGNGVDTAYYAPDGTPELPGRLVFEGSMSFLPNEHAALHLLRDIMPRVWARRPDASVALVGRDPGPALRVLADDRVIVTGSVPDVRRHVREAQVFVCPLVDGAGIKNKLLQAWGMARPVVATPLATGGLDARDGVELLVRGDPAAFADTVVELLADEGRRRMLGAAGRAAAVERFAWAAMAARLEQVMLASARAR